MASYSVKAELRGATVFLTGATGYIGGLVLEKLLRSTDVELVYVLLRPKGASSVEDRLTHLLQSNIFHLVRDQQQLLQKVKPIHGDITQQGLGLEHSSRQLLEHTVDIILHCAADIRLEVDIHSALQSNYLGTEALLQLACNCQRLKALVHTSSCFVNMNQPRSSVVFEQLYPLSYGTTPVDVQALVKDLLALPGAAADTRATALGLRWGFPNNYTFSKHLAEQLVAQYHRQRQVPAAIVRPSLVCSVAYEPIPGYIGNWAGPIGASAALAIGFYHSLGCVSSQPLHVWDCMPAEMVANAIIATAAATAAGQGASIQQAAAQQRDCSSSADILHGTGASGQQQMLIVQSSSSSTYPMTLMEGWNHALEFIQVHKPRFRLSWAKLPKMSPTFKPDPDLVRRERRWTTIKVRLACVLLRLFGLARAAARLESGFEALCVYGTSKTDKDLVFSADALQMLEQQMQAAEQEQYRLVMRPGLPLPNTLLPAAASTKDSISGGASGKPLLSSTVASQQHKHQHKHQHGHLTWRRYYHSQLAAVYSSLFRMSVPKEAVSADGTVVQHDFEYVR